MNKIEKMQSFDEKYEWRQAIFRAVKHHFIDTIGKFTHHKYEPDFHFRGLAFVKGEMTYVFGLNIGFFRVDKSLPEYSYDFLGANVLIRTNGDNTDLRNKYRIFFEKNLQDWIMGDKSTYAGPRGDFGILLPHYAKIEEFQDDLQRIEFIKTAITKLSTIYDYIIGDKTDIFANVVRGNPPWDETIIEIAKEIKQLK